MLKEVRDFAHFEYLLCQRLGFKKIPPKEAKEQLQQADKRSSRPLEGTETGFRFDRRGLTLKVWTSYLEDKEKFRERGTDAGWVLIIQNGKAVHFSRPAPRTENFLLNLYRRVWINWCRVLNRPSCPECGKYMNIKRGRHLRQRFWSCERWELHEVKKSHTLDLNFALPPKAKKWIEKAYRKRKKYNAQVKKSGKQPCVAMLKRKKWIPAGSKTSKD